MDLCYYSLERVSDELEIIFEQNQVKTVGLVDRNLVGT